jgi:DNA polymerase
MKDAIAVWASVQSEFGEEFVLSASGGGTALRALLDEAGGAAEGDGVSPETRPAPVAVSRQNGSRTEGASSLVSRQNGDCAEAPASVLRYVSYSRELSGEGSEASGMAESRRSYDVVPPAPEASPTKKAALASLKEEMQAFNGCRLKEIATNTVFGDGNPEAAIMIIGEAPGADEDIQGLPFVGRSGQLLDRMLASIGFDRKSVYITNVVNWRPPGNRPPTPEEIEQCRPFLSRHIDIVAPKIIVLLGLTAMHSVLRIKSGLAKAREVWFHYTMSNGVKVKTMVTFHPSYLLRSPGQKVFAWKDLQRLRGEFDKDAFGATEPAK